MNSRDRGTRKKLRLDVLAAFAALALALAACQGGLDSGGSGMMGGGDMAPPVSNPGSIGASPGPLGSGGLSGPTTGPNGQEELTNPGSTLAPNEAQYPVGQGPNGMKCPLVQQITCSVSFNLPPPSPSPSPSGSPGSKSTPKPTPTPSPTPSASSSDDPGDDTPTPSPTPPGTITLQMEPLPKDVPSMTNPDPRLLHVGALIAIRLQSDTNFTLNGGAQAAYSLPVTQTAGHVFTLQLYNETSLRGKRNDQFLGSYDKWTGVNGNVTFAFTIPKVVVRRGQIWLLALYSGQFPPGSTPTPSPAPSSSSATSGSSAPSPTPSSGASP